MKSFIRKLKQIDVAPQTALIIVLAALAMVVGVWFLLDQMLLSFGGSAPAALEEPMPPPR